MSADAEEDAFVSSLLTETMAAMDTKAEQQEEEEEADTRLRLAEKEAVKTARLIEDMARGSTRIIERFGWSTAAWQQIFPSLLKREHKVRERLESLVIVLSAEVLALRKLVQTAPESQSYTWSAEMANALASFCIVDVSVHDCAGGANYSSPSIFLLGDDWWKSRSSRPTFSRLSYLVPTGTMVTLHSGASVNAALHMARLWIIRAKAILFCRPHESVASLSALLAFMIATVMRGVTRASAPPPSPSVVCRLCDARRRMFGGETKHAMPLLPLQQHHDPKTKEKERNHDVALKASQKIAFPSFQLRDPAGLVSAQRRVLETLSRTIAPAVGALLVAAAAKHLYADLLATDTTPESAIGVHETRSLPLYRAFGPEAGWLTAYHSYSRAHELLHVPGLGAAIANFMHADPTFDFYVDYWLANPLGLAPHLVLPPSAVAASAARPANAFYDIDNLGHVLLMTEALAQFTLRREEAEYRSQEADSLLADDGRRRVAHVHHCRSSVVHHLVLRLQGFIWQALSLTLPDPKTQLMVVLHLAVIAHHIAVVNERAHCHLSFSSAGDGVLAGTLLHAVAAPETLAYAHALRPWSSAELPTRVASMCFPPIAI